MEEGIKRAVENIIKVNLGLKEEDRFLIVTDRESLFLGDPLAEKAQEVCATKKIVIEEFGQRPLSDFPSLMQKEIEEFSPTVSIYCAQAKQGELPVFRRPLIELLVHQFKVRHAHMPGVSREMVNTGLSQDYNLVANFTLKIYEIVKEARTIKVEDPFGTSLEITLSPDLKWIPDTGIFREPREWGNLPAGEVFTCPEKVEGTLVAWEAGDYFSEKYGKLSEPVILEISDSRVTALRAPFSQLQQELESYLGQEENSNRAGEVAIGTLVGLTDLIGNLLQDEKFPGFHMAFGHPYPEKTGQKNWTANTHIDFIALKPSIWVDDLQIMKEGEFQV